MALKNVKKSVVREHDYGVCLWEVDGGYVSDGDNGYLSLEGRINDRNVEARMRIAARYWLGLEIGQPVWIEGARKITTDEWEDQKARLIDGEIPDEIEARRQDIDRSKGKL